MKKCVGVLGTGLVGSAIAALLLEQGICVYVWNRTKSKTGQLVEQGAVRADTPAELGEECSHVFISVMTTDVVAKLCEEPDGLLDANDPPQYILDTTTGDPDETVALADRLAKRGISFLDSTISGSSKQIRDRQALYMIGGKEQAFQACEELLKLVTDQYIYVGPSGSGSRAKLASNVILGLNRLALAEGLVFAEKLGIDLDLFLQVLKKSSAYSAAVDIKGGKMINGDFTPQSRIIQHNKDVSIIMKYADRAGQEMPLTRVHKDVMESAIAAGDGELDNSAVIREIRRRSAVANVIETEDFRIIVEEAPEWNELFRRYEGWTGADGIYAIPLSEYEGPGKANETKTLFVFSDSFVGQVGRETGERRDFRMINNSLALLDGGNPVDDNIRFIWGKSSDGDPTSVFVPKTPQAQEKKCWYWLQDGVCLNGDIYILPMLIGPNPSGGEGFKFRISGISMLKIPVGADGPELQNNTQIDAPFFHRDETRTLYFGAGIMPNTIAAGAPEPDGYVYIYGRYEKGEVKLAVARVKAENFEDFDEWRFWDGNDWSKEISHTAPLGRGGPELSVTPVESGPLAGKYLMVSMHVERDLYIRIGDSPVGPFGPRINIYHTTEPDAGQNIYTYNAKAHPNLSRPGEWLISYNVNSTNWQNLTRNADIYRPRFLRVRFEAH